MAFELTILLMKNREIMEIDSYIVGLIILTIFVILLIPTIILCKRFYTYILETDPKQHIPK